jgi:anti-sigma factor RsiW
MNHNEIAELLSDYNDDELTADERAGVDAHLTACADCRQELTFYRRTDGILRAVSPSPTADQTADFRHALLNRLEHPSVAAILGTWMATPRIAIPAYALALVALIAALRPAHIQSYGPADALLISQDGGRTYAWIAKSDVSTTSVFDWRTR